MQQSGINWVKVVAWLVLLGLVGAVVGAFFSQNSGWEAQLSLNLGFWGSELAQPWPVPTLCFVSAGIGLAVGVGWGLVRGWRIRREATRIDEIVPARGSSSDDDWV
jgi:hypothetical protein